MVGLKVKDINKNILTIFILCYEYNLNFTQVLNLYAISNKYFWIFLDTIGNMTKIGIRKALSIKKSVEKILNHLNGEEHVRLTASESIILDIFSSYVESSFTDGETCLSLDQLKLFPAITGYNEQEQPISSSYEDMKKNIDRIGSIKIVDTIYHKTSKMLFYIEKYSGSFNMKEIESMTISELVDVIQEGQENYAKYIEERERYYVS